MTEGIRPLIIFLAPLNRTFMITVKIVVIVV